MEYERLVSRRVNSQPCLGLGAGIGPLIGHPFLLSAADILHTLRCLDLNLQGLYS